MSEKPNVSFDDYRAALVKNEALQTEITQLKDQLEDATDALTIVKAKFDVAEKAEKDSLVTSLIRDGNKPPVCFNILVQGVGFEPTNAYAIGS